MSQVDGDHEEKEEILDGCLNGERNFRGFLEYTHWFGVYCSCGGMNGIREWTTL